ncbi:MULTISPECIES: ABC-2 transporter permease [Paenibacillus]|uniref:ABC-2 transporter permease n=1 Tax=Paenibacillus campinasensis TaxID=66347 RepID=A0A268EEM3_9BACL|nr:MULTISPECIES: ABC-2 transporter permease [Paenibacillus]MUG67055.1 ABC-2 transporter permease [Paenibacillus campinasensis]PAD71565.1 multidrug ABC transporter permease [Paenibacillus campinasensis]PAK50754.1 multidrug ABC transporter permease [Paenibacillus sp. 7541]
MFNLIRRDVILQKRHLLIFLPFIIFFILMSKDPFFIFLVASVFIPFNTYAYDERAETNILLNSLPYTRTEIIAARYLGAIVYMLLSIVLTSLALFIFNKPFTLTDIAIGAGLFIVFAAFTFPLFYIFKPGHITSAVLIGFIVLVGVGPYVANLIAEHVTAVTDFLLSLSMPALYTGATIVIIGIYAVSWAITTTIYQRKAF